MRETVRLRLERLERLQGGHMAVECWFQHPDTGRYHYGSLASEGLEGLPEKPDTRFIVFVCEDSDERQGDPELAAEVRRAIG